MMVIFFTAKMMLMALPLTAMAVTSAGAQSGTLAARGEALLTRECTMCHAIGPAGASPLREAPTFIEIAKRADPGMLRSSLQSGILSGHPVMPKLSLTPNEIEAVLAYLSTIRSP